MKKPIKICAKCFIRYVMAFPEPFRMYAKLLLALKTGMNENKAKRATNAQITLSPFKLFISCFIFKVWSLGV